MAVRLLGALLVVSATGMLGVVVGWWYTHRVRHLYDLSLALHVLETEIGYGVLPLPAALRRAAEAVDDPVAAFFAAVARRLERDPGCTGAEAWRAALDTVGKSLALQGDELRTLRDVGVRLGASHVDDQLRWLRAAQHGLRTKAERAEAQRDNGVRLWRYVGVSSGLITVLLLY